MFTKKRRRKDPRHATSIHCPHYADIGLLLRGNVFSAQVPRSAPSGGAPTVAVDPCRRFAPRYPTGTSLDSEGFWWGLGRLWFCNLNNSPVHPCPMLNLLLPLALSRSSRPFTSSVLAPALRHFPRSTSRLGSPTTATPHTSTPPGQRRTLCQLYPSPPSSGAYRLRSGSGGLVVAASLAVALSLLYYQLRAPSWGQCSDSLTSPDPSSDPAAAMATADLPAGRPGNLTPEEEEKLRRLWSLVLRVFGVDDANPTGLEATVSHTPSEQTTSTQQEKTKKKRSLFSRKNNGAPGSDSPSQSAASVIDPSSLVEGDADDKHGQTRQFHEALSNMSPDSIRETLWSMVKHDNPDALLLRFLRARKWDVEKALVMLISTMNWRASEMHVDDDIMKNGEGGAAEAEKGQDGPAKVLGHEFLDQMRMGKSFLHGVDKVGRPICFVRVRLHRQGDHSEEALERNTVFIIETCRMLLKSPVDTAVSS